MRCRRGWLLSVLGLGVLAAWPTTTEATPPSRGLQPLSVTLPIRFRVAELGGRPGRDKAWLDAQVARANEVFAPTGVRFQPVGSLPLPAVHARLESRQDRHELGRHLEKAVINVFVVDSMRDVDHPEQWRRGVHWRLPWRADHHFVVLTSIGPPTTLAHELGHFFGNRHHRWVPGNIMSYEHGEAPRFDPDQLRRIVYEARRFLVRRRLITLDRWGELTARGVLPQLHYPRAAAAVGGLVLRPAAPATPARAALPRHDPLRRFARHVTRPTGRSTERTGPPTRARRRRP